MNKQALLELVSGVTIVAAVVAFVMIVVPGYLDARRQVQWNQLDLYPDHGTLPIDLVPIGTGHWHTCALTSERGLKCWGNNYFGSLGNGTTVDRSTPVAVNGLSYGVMAMDGGWRHTCVLTIGGGVKCWGGNHTGQLGNGSTTDQLVPVNVNGLTNGVTAISVGGYHTCALTSYGGVKCWGAYENGRLGDGSTVNQTTPVNVVGLSSGVIAIAAGGSHTCALTSGGGVKCWGFNHFGAVGDGTSTDRYTPVDVIGLGSGVTAIAAGDGHTCALTVSHEVKCWGSNSSGQIGDGTTTERHSPVTVIGLGTDVRALAANGSTCVLTASGGVKCWGRNSSGQLGDGTTTDRLTPVNVRGLSSGATAITVGIYHACAQLNDYEYKCWGGNSSGQLGDGTITQRSIPMDVNGLGSGVARLTAGMSHTCALMDEAYSSGVKCWGYNGAGGLGDGTTIQRSTPVNVTGLGSSVMVVMAGGAHTCALTTGGGAKCWGRNYRGQLGDGTTTQRSIPVNVYGLGSGMTALATGYDHTCALTTSGGVKCWGSNLDGQLGDGTNTQRTIPVNVSGLGTGVAALTAGMYHTCSLTTGGGVKCWGGNWDGQLGDGTTTDRNKPVNVSGLGSGMTALAAGEWHTCALTSGGGVKCWGSNWNGQLGDGTFTYRYTPVDVIGLSSGVTAIAAGGGHTCALMDATHGSGVKCWGDNHSGQLGDGTTTKRGLSANVSGLESGVTGLTAGGEYTCALVGDGRPKCWGSDGYGQLGLDTVVQHLTPIPILDTLSARVSLNYPAGRPGSYFTVTGENFPANSTLRVMVNGTVLNPTLHVDEMGGFIFFVTTAGADAGWYSVTAGVNSSASASFLLDSSEPVRQQEGGGQVLNVPVGIAIPAKMVYLPLIRR